MLNISEIEVSWGQYRGGDGFSWYIERFGQWKNYGNYGDGWGREGGEGDYWSKMKCLRKKGLRRYTVGCSDFDFFHILRYNHPSLTP